jgi:hypothetical protein
VEAGYRYRCRADPAIEPGVHPQRNVGTAGERQSSQLVAKYSQPMLSETVRLHRCQRPKIVVSIAAFIPPLKHGRIMAFWALHQPKTSTRRSRSERDSLVPVCSVQLQNLPKPDPLRRQILIKWSGSFRNLTLRTWLRGPEFVQKTEEPPVNVYRSSLS